MGGVREGGRVASWSQLRRCARFPVDAGGRAAWQTSVVRSTARRFWPPLAPPPEPRPRPVRADARGRLAGVAGHRARRVERPRVRGMRPGRKPSERRAGTAGGTGGQVAQTVDAGGRQHVVCMRGEDLLERWLTDCSCSTAPREAGGLRFEVVEQDKPIRCRSLGEAG